MGSPMLHAACEPSLASLAAGWAAGCGLSALYSYISHPPCAQVDCVSLLIMGHATMMPPPVWMSHQTQFEVSLPPTTHMMQYHPKGTKLACLSTTLCMHTQP